MKLGLRVLCLVVPVALAACGGQNPPPATAPTTKAANGTPSAAPTREAQPPGSIRRSDLRAVTAAGLGTFLQHVTLDDHAVFVAGKFHGFRLISLNDPAFRGVELRAGDVITRVNGFPIEHPEDALEVFKSLDVSSEVRIDYERDGVPGELRYAIDEDAGSLGPVPTAKPAPPKGSVKVIH